jgi:holo-[acyl-carrier protein] synthase
MSNIKGIGVDIIEINRIRESIKNYGDKFLNRIYTKRELQYCFAFAKDKIRFPELAVRFAAKEAYSKALGTGIRGIHFKEIEVINNDLGQPHIAVNGETLTNVHVSLSHSHEFAVAMVTIENEKAE